MSLYEGGTVPSPHNRKAFINLPCELIVEFVQKYEDYENGDKWYSCNFFMVMSKMMFSCMHNPMSPMLLSI